MLQLLYLIAFTILAFLAISNLVRSLLSFSADSQRRYAPGGQSQFNTTNSMYRAAPHPELLDETGNLINEPLMVMRSMSVEDARQQLDNLYKSSPGGNGETTDET